MAGSNGSARRWNCDVRSEGDHRPQRLDQVVRVALQAIADLPGVTVSKVHAFSRSQPRTRRLASTGELESDFVKLETVVPCGAGGPCRRGHRSGRTTGRPGDGMVFMIPVGDAVRVRTGEHGTAAL